MKLLLESLPGLKGPTKFKLLTPEAAGALRQAETDLPDLVYLDTWRDPVAQLLAQRLRPDTSGIGYNGHSFGISIDLDIDEVTKKVSYDKLVRILKKRGWHCHRRDGNHKKYGAGHFDFLGLLPEKYLLKANFEPATWNRPAEEYIYERHGESFRMDLSAVQVALSKAGFYFGEVASGELDAYTREAILAFQRAWRLPENGQADTALCRALSIITCDPSFKSA